MRLADASESGYLQEVFECYLMSFPESEQIEIPSLLQMYEDERCQIMAILEQDKFLGLAITFPEPSLTYLAYFAIDSRLRGQGYGGRALQLLKDTYHNLVLEIETTFDPHSKNWIQRKKRKHFYQAHQLNGLNYTVDCYGVEMEIMTNLPHFPYTDYYRLYAKIFGSDEIQGNISLQRILLPAPKNMTKAKMA